MTGTRHRFLAGGVDSRDRVNPHVDGDASPHLQHQEAAGSAGSVEV